MRIRHDRLIRLRNPKIRGLADYYRHVVAKRTFNKVAHAIWQCLWRWAKRRHPQKNAHWVRRKYARTVGAGQWVFGTATDKVLSNGKRGLLTLYGIVGMPNRRHRKIKGAANPFDPQWESYFEERLGFAMMDSLRGRTRLIRLCLDQQRSCPVFHQQYSHTDREPAICILACIWSESRTQFTPSAIIRHLSFAATRKYPSHPGTTDRTEEVDGTPDHAIVLSSPRHVFNACGG
ncbi:group II intron maturase-specific domain-containing protein [Paraburkholderia sp. MM5384-R2]|uniref:group II intron maturase-specific domain-containing protein n=1 Tax=Paraburkholderia sp. MM5384-R2 TaxID=2723097 RepID=UPI003905B95F